MNDQAIASQLMEHTKALNRIAAALEGANALTLVTLTPEQRQALQAAEAAEQKRAHPTVQGGPAALSELGR